MLGNAQQRFLERCLQRPARVVQGANHHQIVGHPEGFDQQAIDIHGRVVGVLAGEAAHPVGIQSRGLALP